MSETQFILQNISINQHCSIPLESSRASLFVQESLSYSYNVLMPIAAVSLVMNEFYSLSAAAGN